MSKGSKRRPEGPLSNYRNNKFWDKKDLTEDEEERNLQEKQDNINEEEDKWKPSQEQ